MKKHLVHTAFFLIGFAALGGLLLSSCGQEAGLFPESGDARAVDVRTIDEGSYLSGGETIDISLETLDEQEFPDRMEVRLVDLYGTEYAEPEVYGETEINRNTAVQYTLPQLESGRYRLEVTVLSGEKLLAEKEVDFFYEEGPFSIHSIDSYPPVIPPGATAILRAEVSSPDDANPYLRWSAGGEVVGEGLLADGLDALQWQAPKEKGAYSIRLDVYPEPPAAGGYSFSSGLYTTVDVFVSDPKKPARYDLVPEQSYSYLYHFRGNYRNSGTKGEEGDLSVIGSPSLSLDSSAFGFQLTGSDGFTLEDASLPVNKGKLQPFSLEFRYLLDPGQKARRLFSLDGAASGMGLEIRIDDAGAYRAVLSVDNETAESTCSYGRVPELRATSLILSVVPEDQGFTLLWYVDDSFVSSDRIEISPPAFGSGGQAGKASLVIGGSDGFSGILDEFGVFTTDQEGRASVRTGMFREKSRARYGDGYIFAEGFEGSHLPSSIGELEGTAGMEESALILGSGNSVELSEFSLGEGVEIRFTGDGPPEAGIVLENGDSGEPLARFGIDGNVLANGEGGGFLMNPEPYSVIIRPEAETLVIRRADANGATDEEIRIPAPIVPDMLRIRAENPGPGNRDLRLESVLIISEQTNRNTPLFSDQGGSIDNRIIAYAAGSRSSLP
ncbi:MAG: hypothetical protein K9L68_09565 [Spirochaetales bacterium]|nr:hypothetical protein [Spirochaetales bacterium]MCF7938832.1 hypothetical protein [Spirochaetales bacterium]